VSSGLDRNVKPFRDGMRGHRGLKIYQLAYRLAMEVFRLSQTFPEDERYSLTCQIRRSSRSVAANIAARIP